MVPRKRKGELSVTLFSDRNRRFGLKRQAEEELTSQLARERPGP